jgi:hypothetical protein
MITRKIKTLMNNMNEIFNLFLLKKRVTRFRKDLIEVKGATEDIQHAVIALDREQKALQRKLDWLNNRIENIQKD